MSDVIVRSSAYDYAKCRDGWARSTGTLTYAPGSTTPSQPLRVQIIDDALGESFLALHTLRCRSGATQHRLAAGEKLGPDTSIDKVLLATAEQLIYDTARDLLPGNIEFNDGEWRTEFLYSRASTIYGGTAEVQRNIIARRLLNLGKE